MTLLSSPTATGTRPAAGRPRAERLAYVAAALTSALMAGLGVLWLARPSLNIYADPMSAWLSMLLGATGCAALQALLGALGTVAALAALAGVLPRPARTAVGIVQVLGFGIVLQGFGTLSTAGYLVAMAMPVVVLVVLVQLLRRYRVARWAVGLPALVALAVVAVVAHDAVVQALAMLASGLADQAAAVGFDLARLAAAAAWAWWSIGTVRRTPGIARATIWVTRHRTVFTLVAACGPLPYALIRLTWLTPWPVFAPLGLDLSTRLWGLTLSSGAWLGVVLTIGLIRPWGERFPRWMPVIAGRSVPVLAAAGPGGLIAAVMTFAAVPVLLSMPQMAAASGQPLRVVQVVETIVVFPCWLWGPSLALAVWGYVGHRAVTGSGKMGR